MSDTFLAGFCIGAFLVPVLLFMAGAMIVAKHSDEAMESHRRNGDKPDTL